MSSWNLPSVKDLLHGPTQPPRPPLEQAAQAPLCPTCMARGRRVDGCLHCVQYHREVPAPTNFPGEHYVSRPYAGSSIYHNVRASAPQLEASRPIAQIPRHSPASTEISAFADRRPSIPSIQPPQQYTYQPADGPTSFSVYQGQGRQRNHSTVSAFSQSSAVSAAAPLTAARIASNDRHKLSEKHRRDGMGAFVQAGHVLRSGLSPGAMFDCELCAQQALNEQEPLQYPTPNSSFSAASNLNGNADIKPKIPKNDMLNDSLVWEFGILLHSQPGKVVDKVEGIKALALQMEAEKQSGIQNDHARRKKWTADVRGQVLMEVVMRMEQSIREHRAHFLDKGRWAGLRQRSNKREYEMSHDDNEDRYSKRREGDVPTPPSSRASPVL